MMSLVDGATDYHSGSRRLCRKATTAMIEVHQESEAAAQSFCRRAAARNLLCGNTGRGCSCAGSCPLVAVPACGHPHTRLGQISHETERAPEQDHAGGSPKVT